MSEPIRCSIGSEPSQRIAADVLRSSILRRTSRPVEFTASWTPEQGWHPLMETVPRLRGTKFSLWRWLVPKLYDYSGQSLYLDADQVVLTDIAPLFDHDVLWFGMFCVCDAEGIFGNKTPEPGKTQTSVMLWDCSSDAASVSDLMIKRVERGAMTYKDLMQATWVDQRCIVALPPEWNHFGIVTPETKLCHWSHVATQPWRNKLHPTADIWQRELFATIEAGHLSPETLREECDKGHVDDIYYKRWKERQ